MEKSKGLILLVDDNPDNLQIAWSILDNAGYDVAILRGGASVCEFAETESVTLILLDVMMPDIDGFEVCRRLKSNLKTNHIPVIFQTGLTAHEDILRGFEAGAVDYVTKPYQKKELLKRVETHVNLRNAMVQLEQKNEEMTHHFYTISHDLKNPLLTISSFLEEMDTDYKNGDLEQVKNDRRFMNKAIQRMKDLLDGLLLVAKAGDRKLELQNLTLEDVAQEVILLLGGRIKEHEVVVHISSEFIPIRGDRSKLIQVLQNLVDNAIKYRNPEQKLVIEIGARKQGNSQTYFVKDNGKGIDPTQANKVFEIFQQTNRDSEGVGLGLFLVKRIIDVHQGRIWVESEGINKGCTFCFTLGVMEDLR